MGPPFLTPMKKNANAKEESMRRELGRKLSGEKHLVES